MSTINNGVNTTLSANTAKLQSVEDYLKVIRAAWLMKEAKTALYSNCTVVSDKKIGIS